MDMHDAAARLDRNQYAEEGSRELWVEMKAAGLVAVFGASDDLTEFRGAIYDEAGAWEGREHYLTRDGLLESKCGEGENCPYFAKLKSAIKPAIRAKWNEGGYSWWIETDLPHATFDIIEDDEPFCRGVVIRVEDLPA
jgi:hypothetical protein